MYYDESYGSFTVYNTFVSYGLETKTEVKFRNCTADEIPLKEDERTSSG